MPFSKARKGQELCLVEMMLVWQLSSLTQKLQQGR